MAVKCKIDGKKLFIEMDLVDGQVSASKLNLNLSEMNGFPKPVKGLSYAVKDAKGKVLELPVSLAINCTIPNPDLPADERETIKTEMQLQRAEQQVAKLKAKAGK